MSPITPLSPMTTMVKWLVPLNTFQALTVLQAKEKCSLRTLSSLRGPSETLIPLSSSTWLRTMSQFGHFTLKEVDFFEDVFLVYKLTRIFKNTLP